MLGVSELLEKSASVQEAARTLSMAVSAWKKGDQRLAVSRAVTAAVQAAVASRRPGASQLEIDRARRIVQGVRNLLQGTIVSRALSGLSAARLLPGWASDDPIRRMDAIIKATVGRRAEKMREEERKRLRQNLPEILERTRRGLLTGSVRPSVNVGLTGKWLVRTASPIDVWDHLIDFVPRHAMEQVPGGLNVQNDFKSVAVTALMPMALIPEGPDKPLDPTTTIEIIAEFDRIVQKEVDRQIIKEAQEMVRKKFGGSR